MSYLVLFFGVYSLYVSAEKSLGLPLPEMTFGNNALNLTYSTSSGSSSRSGGSSDEEAKISFNALDALGEVAVGEGWEERVGGGVRVAMADFWGKNRYVLPLPLYLNLMKSYVTDSAQIKPFSSTDGGTASYHTSQAA